MEQLQCRDSLLTSRNEHCTSSNGPGGSHRQQNTSTRAHVKTSPCVLTSPIGGLEKALRSRSCNKYARDSISGASAWKSSYLQGHECVKPHRPRASRQIYNAACTPWTVSQPMDFWLAWLLVLVADFLVWLLCARYHGLRLVIDQHFHLPRPSAGRKQLVRLLDGLDDDRLDLAGFSPPRVTRFAIGTVVVLQNIAAVALAGRQGSIQVARRRLGQLACVNTLALPLLAFAEMGLGDLVRQCAPQVRWAHHLFGWIVWYEALLHMLLPGAAAVGSCESPNSRDLVPGTG